MKNKNRNEIVRALAMVTQLGMSMLAPVILCAVFGLWIDERYGWSITAILLVLGVLAGARNTWMMLQQIQQISGSLKGGHKDGKEDK